MAKIEKATPVPDVPKVQVTLRSEDEVLDFIQELQDALKSSRKTGGHYYAGVWDDTGRIIVDVWVPGTVRKARKK